jgi:quinol monooxygenase YgiN
LVSRGADRPIPGGREPFTEERIIMPESEIRLSRRVLIAGGVAGGVLATLPAQSQTGSLIMDTTIRVDRAVTTLVNLFTVEPDNQPKVHALLQDSVETMFSTMPGWISSNILDSKDRRQIIIYSQWRDARDIDGFRQDPRLKPYLQQLGALAKHESFTCDVSYTQHA